VGYFIVTDTLTKNGDKPVRHLVNAKNKAQALSAIVQPRYSVVAADSKDLIELAKAGVDVIEVKKD
jgi:hypothetical protein